MSTFSTESTGVTLEVSQLNRYFDKEAEPQQADFLKRSEPPEKVHVLKNFSFKVAAGEIFVIMGSSGSGKSVLLRHLIGLETPDSGEILVAGENIMDSRIRDRYRMAMVFQSGALLNSLSVGENVGLFLTEHRLMHPDEIAKEVRKNLDLVGLTKVSETSDPSRLSGGQKKRVAIARALIIEPHLIFYDEPTSELDPENAELIGTKIKELNDKTGVTSIVVTHDPKLAHAIGHRIADMKDGFLTEQTNA